MDKIICLGKNELGHAKELGDAVPEQPVLFLKPFSVLKQASKNREELLLSYPKGRGSLHFETEVVLLLGQGGFQMSESEAHGAIAAFSLGLDMTLRDLQTEQKKAGHPWTTSKVFPDSAVVGPWLQASNFDLRTENSVFSFFLDERQAQQGSLASLRLSPAQCVAYASTFFRLLPGDLIFTGTPAGVGPVNPGQRGRLCYGQHIEYFVRWP